jgi:hypothetical protein
MKTRPGSQPRASHTRLLALAAGMLLTALPLTVLAAAGDLDTTFDGDGKARTAIGAAVVQAPTHLIGLPGGHFGRDREYLPMPLLEEQQIRPEDGSCGAPNSRLADSDEGIRGEGRIRVAQTGDDKGTPGRKGEKKLEGANPGARSRCPDECAVGCCQNCRGCICCANPDMAAPLDNASRIKGGYKPLPDPRTPR